MTPDPHTEDTRILPSGTDETAPLRALAAERPGDPEMLEATVVVPTEQTEAIPAEQTEAIPTEQTEAIHAEQTEATPTEQTEAIPAEENEVAPGDRSEGATFPLDPTATLAAEAAPEALAPDQPAAPVAPKVWTAADAPAQGASGRSTHVRVGQLIWGCIVALLGVFFIALPFISNVDVPALFIGLVGLLGLSLIVAALVVGKDPAPNRGSH
ncbi:hypothetical protein [Schaalia hyovaginalis]|uniref:hypothetical protein n=1 Tax=Schaalia hyovaginalis TaxID=29316 RepID=UPI001F32B871|nr:hypothetical protein [Schaalia hyovaginalis]MCF2711538.1 hypothetical protein [Schaalia hyovaginalis]